MELPAPPTTQQHDQLATELRIFPGFKYLADHLTQGPYRVVAVEKVHRPGWLPKAILDMFTPVTAPALSYWDGTKVGTLALYLLPELVADLLVWHEDENEYEIDSESNSEVWPYWPDESDWADYLGWLISHEDPTSDEVTSCVETITALGVLRYLELAAQAPEHVRDAKETFHAFLLAAAD